MERFRQLVEELNQQLLADASPEMLRQTLALLNLELDRITGSTDRSLGTAKVAVVLPQTPLSIETNADDAPPPIRTDVLPVAETIPKSVPMVLFDEEFVVEQIAPPVTSSASTSSAAFNVMEEVPTLYMHRHAELNEKLISDVPSLNDQLKATSNDRYDTLQEGPIADLRKAIGINERFQFIRELFRNDEAMYERSIKTINQFQVQMEADFWINRELKTKLGWPVDHALVKLFDQLVKRRFS